MRETEPWAVALDSSKRGKRSVNVAYRQCRVSHSLMDVPEAGWTKLSAEVIIGLLAVMWRAESCNTALR
jgi:hypothetical protein